MPHENRSLVSVPAMDAQGVFAGLNPSGFWGSLGWLGIMENGIWN